MGIGALDVAYSSVGADGSRSDFSGSMSDLSLDLSGGLDLSNSEGMRAWLCSVGHIEYELWHRRVRCCAIAAWARMVLVVILRGV